MPSSGDLYQSWALNPVITVPTAPGLNASIKVDNGPESKYVQGDVTTSGTKSVGGRKLSYVIGTDDRVQIDPTTSYPWCVCVRVWGCARCALLLSLSVWIALCTAHPSLLYIHPMQVSTPILMSANRLLAHHYSQERRCSD